MGRAKPSPSPLSLDLIEHRYGGSEVSAEVEEAAVGSDSLSSARLVPASYVDARSVTEAEAFGPLVAGE